MNIGVLGAGSWGTTLSVLLHSNHHRVSLWSYTKEDANAILSTRYNSSYLPDLFIPSEIQVSHSLELVARDKDMLVLSTPAQFLRSVLLQLRSFDFGTPVLVNVAKGVERNSLFRMSEVVAQTLTNVPLENYVCLSGPSHAEEVSIKIPTSVVAASIRNETVQEIQSVFMKSYFRVYASSDVVGVELGGSIKNIIAIGAGIIDGAGFGDNTKAALITRGIAEMRRLGVAMGANPHTFAGLSGLGDLIVTCMSRHSRNRFVGEEIGKGKKLADIIDQMKMIAEGIETTQSVYDLSMQHRIEMPIVQQVHKILFEHKDPKKATEELMTREAKEEVWG